MQSLWIDRRECRTREANNTATRKTACRYGRLKYSSWCLSIFRGMVRQCMDITYDGNDDETVFTVELKTKYPKNLSLWLF
jgi:hypothetical protein